MTFATAVHDPSTGSQLARLDEIDYLACASLALVPMDCDRPHVHLGVRALVARVRGVADVLLGRSDGRECDCDLFTFIPGGAAACGSRADDQRSATLELLAEIDAIGMAIMSVVRSAGIDPSRIACVSALVAKMQEVGGNLYDDLATSQLLEGKFEVRAAPRAVL